MKKIMVLGNYGYGVSGLDGQVIKTINIYNLILKHHPDQTRKVDTLEHIKRPWKIFPLLFNLLKIDTLIIIPGQNCFIYFLPLCYFLSKMAKSQFSKDIAVVDLLCPFDFDEDKPKQSPSSYVLVFSY